MSEIFRKVRTPLAYLKNKIYLNKVKFQVGIKIWIFTPKLIVFFNVQNCLRHSSYTGLLVVIIDNLPCKQFLLITDFKSKTSKLGQILAIWQCFNLHTVKTESKKGKTFYFIFYQPHIKKGIKRSFLHTYALFFFFITFFTDQDIAFYLII